MCAFFQYHRTLTALKRKTINNFLEVTQFMHADTICLQEFVSKEKWLHFLKGFLSLKSFKQKESTKSNTENRNVCTFSITLNPPTSASSPWWCKPRCVGKSASAGINSPFKLNRACIPYSKRVEEENRYFYCCPLKSSLKITLFTSPAGRWQFKNSSGLNFLKNLTSYLSFFLSFTPVSSQITMARLSLSSSLECYRLNWSSGIPSCERKSGIFQPDEIPQTE